MHPTRSISNPLCRDELKGHAYNYNVQYCLVPMHETARRRRRPTRAYYPRERIFDMRNVCPNLFRARSAHFGGVFWPSHEPKETRRLGKRLR